MAASINREIRIKSIALPAEHGGWGFLIEPIVLGLLAAWSGTGLWLALMAFSIFLTRHPGKLMLGSYRRGKRYTRTQMAESFVLLYGGFAAIALVAVIDTAGSDVLQPLVVAAPLVLVQFVYDLLGRSRELFPELAGASAMGAMATAIAIAGGWDLTPALALWAIVTARVIPSVLYVRARLRLEKGQPTNILPPLVAHVAALAGLWLLALAGYVPGLALLAMVILLARAAYGLSSYRRPSRAVVVGIQELVFGFLIALLAGIGFSIGGMF